jgi:methionine biosynthesis protein MetW
MDRFKPDYELILKLVQPKSKVLDLGCGSGNLLENLIKDRQVQGLGVDKSGEQLNEALAKGLSVIQMDLDKGLETFSTHSFDYAILNMTLQAVYHPQLVLNEMVRIGKYAIVGFPNFGNWRLRWALAIAGRMPKSKTLPFEWYNTPNIRLMSVKDFREFCKKNKIKILKEYFLGESGLFIPAPLANLCAAEGVFLLQK